MKKILFICIFALTGCTTMLTHIPLTHSQTLVAAEELATYDSCAEQGHANKDDVAAYKSAVAQLLTVSSYNSNTFNTHYSTEIYHLKDSTSDFFKKKCSNFQSSHESLTSNILLKFQEISDERRMDVVGMLGAASSFNPPTFVIPTFVTPNLVNTQPNFGIPKSRSSHYLVNTSSGFRQCSITSGIAMCR